MGHSKLLKPTEDVKKQPEKTLSYEEPMHFYLETRLEVIQDTDARYIDTVGKNMQAK